MAKSVQYKGCEWTLEKVRERISTKDKACLKALVLIQSFQTADEQDNDTTLHVNGKGWNASDGGFMGSLAKQYSDTGSLSPKQMKSCKKAIKKYAGQVFNHIVKLSTNEA